MLTCVVVLRGPSLVTQQEVPQQAVLYAQMSAELKGYMEGAGPDVADTVAARMADLANAVFPMSPMERQPTKLALLGDWGVSLRGAEVCPQAIYFPVMPHAWEPGRSALWSS